MEQYRSGNVAQAVVLVNNATDTAWFHAAAAGASALCFPRGRVKFWQPGRDAAGPLQGQTVLYLGHKRAKFRSVFAQFGLTASI